MKLVESWQFCVEVPLWRRYEYSGISCLGLILLGLKYPLNQLRFGMAEGTGKITSLKCSVGKEVDEGWSGTDSNAVDGVGEVLATVSSGPEEGEESNTDDESLDREIPVAAGDCVGSPSCSVVVTVAVTVPAYAPS